MVILFYSKEEKKQAGIAYMQRPSNHSLRITVPDSIDSFISIDLIYMLSLSSTIYELKMPQISSLVLEQQSYIGLSPSTVLLSQIVNRSVGRNHIYTKSPKCPSVLI